MIDGILSLEKAALERLTQDRLASGSLGQEVDDMLSAAGVYWDEIEQEYFNIDAFQREIYQGLVQEYVSQNDA
tara:strand:+ start:1802 stop:2020 length:219 start_codon:yes stop_codon:yes gene_type:complete